MTAVTTRRHLSEPRVGRGAAGRSLVEAGLSLVEATIILAVLSTLTAVISPSIRGFSDTARRTRAQSDCGVIAGAIETFIEDTGEVQFLNRGNGSDGQPPRHDDAYRVNLLVSSGDVPALGNAVSSERFWTAPVDGRRVDTLSNHLVENTPGNDPVRRWRTASDITRDEAGNQNIDFARPESSGYNAPFAWRGAYLSAPVGADPWGNRYAVNVAFLDPRPMTEVSGVTPSVRLQDYAALDVFCLSPGGDHQIDTRSAQDGAVAGGDDIIEIVSSHAR